MLAVLLAIVIVWNRGQPHLCMLLSCCKPKHLTASALQPKKKLDPGSVYNHLDAHLKQTCTLLPDLFRKYDGEFSADH